MNTRYYLSWFNDLFPEKLVKWLHEDITDRKSLVMISAQPSGFKGEQLNIDDVPERIWCNQANIIFDEYHLIDLRMQKEEAQRLIQNASVIFLCGGNPILQNNFLAEYEIADAIKNSKTVVIGASAGAINMAAKWLCSKNNGYKVETTTIYNGIGFDDFAYETHSKLDYGALVQGYLFPLSEKIDVYATEQESTMRVKDGKIDIIGNVYLISHSKIQKLVEKL
ncbi:cyanophycinase [Paenibacillus shirakamiensis]|uniref:Cyanophycinase n=1 Tax=Paenibacillus shirakamiensis TaxID=1265935 RepID=A0ABS4JMF2_9BACL|nr:Type 1 glutamine amidotransferase-like domain-containing protein [Paenibacillus shirakamiensis]MBP2002300.1 cyanophycinase [Paenibacillus shirakamiensis]